LNGTRAKNLEAQGFKVTRDDAADEATFAGRAGQMDAVIANPPFGAVREGGKSKVFTIGDYNTTQIDHAIALNALRTMKADGRAVLIIGGVTAETPKERAEGYTAKTKRRFFYQLFSNYNVSDIFTVDGSLYAKQGAGWPVDVIVIDGKGKTERAPLTKEPPVLLKSWDEVGAKLNEAKQREDSGAAAPDTPGQDSETGGAPVEGERRPAGGNALGGEQASGSKPTQLEPAGGEPAGMGRTGDSPEPGPGGSERAVAEGAGFAPGGGGNVRKPNLEPNPKRRRPVRETPTSANTPGHLTCKN